MPLADAGQAAARPAGARDRARRRQRDDQGRHARRRRDQPRSREGLPRPRRSAPISTIGSTSCRSHIPPLRARREDIPLLARALPRARRARRTIGPASRIEDDAIQVLAAYSFPGNVRELRNLIERLVILTPDDVIDAADVRDLPPGRRGAEGAGPLPPGRSVPRARRGGRAPDHPGRARPPRRTDGRDGARARSRAEPPLQEGAGARAPRRREGRRRRVAEKVANIG